MNEPLASGAVVIIVSFVIWLAMRHARAQGAAEQRAKDIKAGSDAEFEIHEIQNQQRDPQETKRRLDRGDF